MHIRDIPSPLRKFVYIIDFGDKIKIGRSKNPVTRIRNIETQSGTRSERRWLSPCLSDSNAFERFLHEFFSSHRRIGEYFVCKFDDAVSAAEKYVENFILTEELVAEYKEYEKENEDKIPFIGQIILSNKVRGAIRFMGDVYAYREALVHVVRRDMNINVACYDDIPFGALTSKKTLGLLLHCVHISGAANAVVSEVVAMGRNPEEESEILNHILQRARSIDVDESKTQDILNTLSAYPNVLHPSVV